MKTLPLLKQIAFSIGQLGWSLLSGLFISWMVYVYQPTAEAHLPNFLPAVMIFGFITIVGAAGAFQRLFDALIDPLIAGLSDRSKHPNGRRIPFMKWASVPFALSTFLIFVMPVNGVSWLNVAWLVVMLIIYDVAITAYVTPFNALIPALGKTRQERLNICTFISFTFILGAAIAYIAPMLWEQLMNNGWEKIMAMRMVFGCLSAFALVCLLVPVFAINEKVYADSTPSEAKILESLVSAFKNDQFRIFVASDVSYYIALALFQTGLPYYVRVLLRLPEGMISLLFITMTGASLLFYVPINFLAAKLGKKNILLVAFAVFSADFLLTFFVGIQFPMSLEAQGYLLVTLAAVPLAIFGILPQAIVADISQYDFERTGENREGMFYAARTFAFKLGQMIAMVLFTAFLTLGSDYVNDIGVRYTALAAGIFCIVGLGIFTFYNEKKVNEVLSTEQAG